MTAANRNVAVGPMVAGGAVILTGEWLEAARQAVLIAARARRLNGLPASATQTALACALSAAVSADGQTDVRKMEVVQHVPREHPTVTIGDAAAQLGLSRRQVRRIAPELGGRKIGGQWLLDQTAINDHKKGT